MSGSSSATPAFGEASMEEHGVDGKNCPVCHMPNNPCLCDDDFGGAGMESFSMFGLPPDTPAFGDPSTEEHEVEGKNCPICHMPNNPCLCDDDGEEMFPPSPRTKQKNKETRDLLQRAYIREINDLVKRQPHERNPLSEQPPHMFLMRAYYQVEHFFHEYKHAGGRMVFPTRFSAEDAAQIDSGRELWEIKYTDAFTATCSLAQIVEVGFETLTRVRGSGLPAPAQVLSEPHHWFALELRDQWALLECMRRWNLAKTEGRWVWNEAQKDVAMRDFHEWQERMVVSGMAKKWTDQIEADLCERGEQEQKEVDLREKEEQQQQESQQARHQARKRKRADRQPVAQTTPVTFHDEQPAPELATNPVPRAPRGTKPGSRKAVKGRDQNVEPSQDTDLAPMPRGPRSRKAGTRRKGVDTAARASQSVVENQQPIPKVETSKPKRDARGRKAANEAKAAGNVTRGAHPVVKEEQPTIKDEQPTPKLAADPSSRGHGGGNAASVLGNPTSANRAAAGDDLSEVPVTERAAPLPKLTLYHKGKRLRP